MDLYVFVFPSWLHLHMGPPGLAEHDSEDEQLGSAQPSRESERRERRVTV